MARLPVVDSRELKTRLGTYLNRVRRGETILVTDGNEPVAELRPLRGERPPDEIGCLYYAVKKDAFVMPSAQPSLRDQGLVLHFGAPYGVVPRIADERVEGIADGRASGGV